MSTVWDRLQCYIGHLGWNRGLRIAVHRQLGKFLNPGAEPAWGSLG